MYSLSKHSTAACCMKYAKYLKSCRLLGEIMLFKRNNKIPVISGSTLISLSQSRAECIFFLARHFNWSDNIKYMMILAFLNIACPISLSRKMN